MSPRRVLSAASIALSLLASRAALADDCPPGSRSKSENGFTWCEASVCLNDGSCSPGEVCVVVPLCVQVGKVDPGGPGLAKDGGAMRLVATGRCGPEKKCADSTTTCLEGGRCVAKEVATKNGFVAPGAASAAPSGSAPEKAADKATSKCGCRAAGLDAPASTGALAGLAIGLAALVRRRRADRARA